VVVAGLMFLSALQISGLYSKLYSGDLKNDNNFQTCVTSCENSKNLVREKWSDKKCEEFCKSERSKQMTKDSVNLMEPVKYSAAV
jgi:hypothetical protein